jgi:hypothetical protein
MELGRTEAKFFGISSYPSWRSRTIRAAARDRESTERTRRERSIR